LSRLFDTSSETSGSQEVDGSIPFSSTISNASRPEGLFHGHRAHPAGRASRLTRDPPNFAPVAAIGCSPGATLNRRAAWLVPLAALLLE